MQITLALVGRPNVGKSTLFNRLTRSRDALVADLPGLTRDRKYGLGRIGHHDYLVIDTGGLGEENEAIDRLMGEQTHEAMREATHILLIIDGSTGVTAGDEMLASELRMMDKPVILVVNKCDRTSQDAALSEAHRLGLGEPLLISAMRNRGLDALVDFIFTSPSATEQTDQVNEDSKYEEISDAETSLKTQQLSVRDMATHIAFVGRPNVGKSTLVNRLLGEERVLVFDHPGTTRDSIETPFKRAGKNYTLIDTAGVRRRARVNDKIEKFSVVKTLEAIESSDVVILVMDAQAGITEQDSHLLGLILDAGVPLVVAINKWDGLASGERLNVKRGLSLRLKFLDFAERHYISALHGTGVGHLLEAVNRAAGSLHQQVSTAELNRMLEEFITLHQPPMSRGRRIKLRYAHLGGRRPFTIVVHGNQTDQLPGDYKRYLANSYRKALNLIGTPVSLEFRKSENPYAGRKNLLTPRQVRKKNRLMRHVKHNRRG